MLSNIKVFECFISEISGQNNKKVGKFFVSFSGLLVGLTGLYQNRVSFQLFQYLMKV